MPIHHAERPVVRQREPEYQFYVDQRGRQHFNFRQTLRLKASVDMAFTRVYSAALKTLAANLLAQVLGKSARAAVQLAPAFCRECLMGAPDRAWSLPKSAIEAWVATKQRRLQHQRRQRASHRDAKVARRK